MLRIVRYLGNEHERIPSRVNAGPQLTYPLGLPWSSKTFQTTSPQWMTMGDSRLVADGCQRGASLDDRPDRGHGQPGPSRRFEKNGEVRTYSVFKAHFDGSWASGLRCAYTRSSDLANTEIGSSFAQRVEGNGISYRTTANRPIHRPKLANINTSAWSTILKEVHRLVEVAEIEFRPSTSSEDTDSLSKGRRHPSTRYSVRVTFTFVA